MEKDSVTSLIHSYTKTSSVASRTLTLSQIPKHQHYNTSTPDKTLVVGGNTDIYGYSGIGATTSPGVQWGKGVYPEGGSASHTHSLNTTTDSTTSTGSGTAVSIVQSYYTVYIWTRTV